MTSFQAKIGRKRLRKRENKTYPFVPFLLRCDRKFQKNDKKIQKTKKISLWLHFKPKQA